MKKPIFEGVCTALVTPFRRDGSLDPDMATRLLRRQEENGVRAVVLSGTTGESPTLSVEEKLRLFRLGREVLSPGTLVIAGTGSNDTAKAVELSRKAEQAGVDALLVVSPYYNKATPEGLITHYTKIAQAVDLPIILYNVPGRTGVDVPVEVYAQLCKIPNIAGVKEASGNLSKIARIRQVCGPDFSVWSGNDDSIVPTLSLGGRGVVSVLSNLCPEETVAMADAGLRGDFKTAGAMQCRLMPLIDALFHRVNPIPIKAALGLIGLDCGPCRLPLTELPPEETAELGRVMESCGIRVR